MQKIILTGAPISTNSCYRHSRNITYLTPKARKLRKDYTTQAQQQWKKPPLKTELFIDIILYFGDKRKRDWDNYHKLSMDSLEGVVFENDCQIKEATVHKEYDKENPRIEIIII